jgi:hypothetical protein
MPTKPSARALKREARAGLYYALYASMGPTRSIAAVSAAATAAMVPASVPTIARYSKDFHWQDRVAEFDAKRVEGVENLALGTAIARDLVHVRDARRIQDAAMLALDARMMPVPEGQAAPEPPTLVEIGRAYDIAMKAERLASGKATSIHHVLAEFYSITVRAIVVLYGEALDKALAVVDPHINYSAEVRAQARDAALAHFAPGADRLFQEHLLASGLSRDIQIVNEPPEGDAE